MHHLERYMDETLLVTDQDLCGLCERPTLRELVGVASSSDGAEPVRSGKEVAMGGLSPFFPLWLLALAGMGTG